MFSLSVVDNNMPNLKIADNRYIMTMIGWTQVCWTNCKLLSHMYCDQHRWNQAWILCIFLPILLSLSVGLHSHSNSIETSAVRSTDQAQSGMTGQWAWCHSGLFILVCELGRNLRGFCAQKSIYQRVKAIFLNLVFDNAFPVIFCITLHTFINIIQRFRFCLKRDRKKYWRALCHRRI